MCVCMDLLCQRGHMCVDGISPGTHAHRHVSISQHLYMIAKRCTYKHAGIQTYRPPVMWTNVGVDI